jgi:hypothetical protein
VILWFQASAFKCNLCRYAAAREQQLAEYTKQQQTAGFRANGAAPAPAPNPTALSAEEQQVRPLSVYTVHCVHQLCASTVCINCVHQLCA